MKRQPTRKKAGQGGPLRLTLPRSVVRRLATVGIFCRPEVSVEHQHLAKRYVVRGVESGGAIKELGRYVSFCGENGEPLLWLQPLDSPAVNGVHAVVVAPVLVSVEVFRCKHTYELLIAKHGATSEGARRRPRLTSEVLFRGVHGHLPLELWGKDKDLAGKIAPEFFTRGGERREIPAAFLEAVRAVAAGAACIGCGHTHFLRPPMPEEPDPATPNSEEEAAVPSDLTV